MKLPIFGLHKVGQVHSKYWMSQLQLFTFCQTIKAMGYNTITMQEFCDSGITVENPIVLTFDDSYENVLTDALPILKRFGMKATVFVPTGFIGKTNREWENYDIVPVPHMTEGQLKHLHENDFDIQPHTVNHKNLTRISEADRWFELTQSKSDLERLLLKRCDVFCYPGGGKDDAIKQQVKNAGYKMAVCCDVGISDTDNMDSFAIKRLTTYSEIV